MIKMIRDTFTNKESVREITFQYNVDSDADMSILKEINKILLNQPLCTNCINCYQSGCFGGYNAIQCKIHGNIEAFDNPHHDMDGRKCDDYKRN